MHGGLRPGVPPFTMCFDVRADADTDAGSAGASYSIEHPWEEPNVPYLPWSCVFSPHITFLDDLKRITVTVVGVCGRVRLCSFPESCPSSPPAVVGVGKGAGAACS